MQQNGPCPHRSCKRAWKPRRHRALHRDGI